MGKRSGTRESLMMVIALIKAIPKTTLITASELRDKLKDVGIIRSLKTVQSVMSLLCEELHIEKNDRGKPYGYKWGKNDPFFVAARIQRHEALLLKLTKEHLTSILPVNILNSLSNNFDEAGRNLADDKKYDNERRWLDKVKVINETPLLPPRIDEQVLRSVSEALFTDKMLKIEYRNSRNEVNKPTIVPLGIVKQSDVLYLVCKFSDANKEKILAVHRIIQADISTMSCPESAKAFSLERYIASGAMAFGDGIPCVLSFYICEAMGIYLEERPLSKDQHIEKFPDRWKINATVIKSWLLENWLNSYGEWIWDVTYKYSQDQ